MIQEVGQQTQDQKNIMLSHFLGHYAWLEIHQERTNQQGDQGQLPMGPIVHLLNSAEAGWVTLHHTLTLKRENSDINLFFYLLQLLMNLHANLNFLHPDQINQSIDKWKFIKWTLALGKMKEDRIAAILFQSFFFYCTSMMDIRKDTFNDINIFPLWQTVMMAVYILMGWLHLTSRQVLRNLDRKPEEGIWGIQFLGLGFFLESLTVIYLSPPHFFFFVCVFPSLPPSLFLAAMHFIWSQILSRKTAFPEHHKKSTAIMPWILLWISI